MKKLLMMMILLGAVLFAAAQETLVSHKSFGSKAAYEVTLTNDTVEFTPKYSVTNYVFDVDTTIYIFADSTKAEPGNVLYYKITSDATKRYVYFKDNFKGVGTKDSLNVSKTRVWGFVYLDGDFVQTIRSAEY